VRMSDAAELIALDVFNTAQAAGEPVSTELVKRHVAELLAHPPECACGRCEAAATARVGHVYAVAIGFQNAIAKNRRLARR
jgi:hypothetical protein